MELVDKIQVAGIVYAIGLPNGLTEEQQAVMRANIGVDSAEERVTFAVDGQTLVLTKGVPETPDEPEESEELKEEGGEDA